MHRDRDYRDHRDHRDSDQRWDRREYRSGRQYSGNRSDRNRDYRDRSQSPQGRRAASPFSERRHPSSNSDRSKAAPNSRVILQNLNYATVEATIRDALYFMQIQYKQVEIARDFSTGAPRGFGFIEFASVDEARVFMDRYYPKIELDGRIVYLNYSRPDLELPSVDWSCFQCNTTNYKSRATCFRCGKERSAAAAGPISGTFSAIASQSGTAGAHPSPTAINIGEKDVSAIPNQLLVICNLDKSVTEQEVHQLDNGNASRIAQVLNAIAPVVQVRLMKDKVTGRPASFAFAEMRDIAMAAYVLQVVSADPNFRLGSSGPVSVSYAQPTSFTINEEDGSAKYWDDSLSFTQYDAPPQNDANSVVSGNFDVVLPEHISNNVKKQEPKLDDELAAFYADLGELIAPEEPPASNEKEPTSDLSNKIANPTSHSALSSVETESPPVAVVSAPSPPIPEAAIVASIPEPTSAAKLKPKKAALDKKMQEQIQRWKAKEEEITEAVEEQEDEPPRARKKQEQSGSSIPREPRATIPLPTDDDLADYNISACLLCQRQFKSNEDLKRHQQLSQLHKTNMEKHLADFYIKKRPKRTVDESAGSSRPPRMPFLPAPRPRKTQEQHARERGLLSAEEAARLWEAQQQNGGDGSIESSVVAPVLKDSVGSKLLQKMGWKEGSGLGKDESGITAPVEHETYTSKVGVGAGTRMTSTQVAELAMGGRKQTMRLKTQMRLQENR